MERGNQAAAAAAGAVGAPAVIAGTTGSGGGAAVAAAHPYRMKGTRADGTAMEVVRDPSGRVTTTEFDKTGEPISRSSVPASYTRPEESWVETSEANDDGSTTTTRNYGGGSRGVTTTAAGGEILEEGYYEGDISEFSRSNPDGSAVNSHTRGDKTVRQYWDTESNPTRVTEQIGDGPETEITVEEFDSNFLGAWGFAEDF